MNNKGRMHLRKKFLLIPLLILILFSLKPVLAEHIIDADPPSCNISFSPPSLTRAGTPIVVTVTATDTSGISPIILSSDGSSLATSSTSPLTYSWTPTTADTYTVTASVIDGAGNNIAATTPCSAGYTYIINPAVGAWIQAVGDVHSNTSINASGGP